MPPTDPAEIPPPSPDDVLYRSEGEVAWITLNRPVVLNAINWSVQRLLMDAVRQAEADPAVRAVIIHGAGRAFSAGGDLQAGEPDDGEPVPDEFDIFLAIWRMPKPFIAAVHGYALGMACQLAEICDLTIAAEDARLGEVEIRHGFAPPILIAPYLMGAKQAKEFLMLGEMYTAVEAQRLGLVNRVVAADQLLIEAGAIARKLAALPGHAVGRNKLIVNRVHELAGFEAALRYRSDPLIAALDDPNADLENPHLKALREEGWGAFRASRDVLYGEPPA
jgi:enoyl-CoA hydratase/carnithine racemase